MLTVSAIETGYGKKTILGGVSLRIRAGEMVALIGPNGAGKSTVLRAIHGLLPIWHGSIDFDGHDLRNTPTPERVAMGVVFSPQGSRVFPDLTVRENLEIGGFRLPKAATNNRINEMAAMFEALRTKLSDRAGNLSGGEQQVVALARALMPMPKLLLLDEPTLGLSPGLARMFLAEVARVNKSTGAAVLIVEHRVREVLAVCERILGMKYGQVCFEGAAKDLATDAGEIRNIFL